MTGFVGGGSGKQRLRWFLALFFVALAIPSAVLTWQAYSRLQWERFHQYQVMAEELRGRIARRMRDLVAREEARAFDDYGFLAVGSMHEGGYAQRSPLSSFPVNGPIPGLIGYFQVDAHGRFTTPLLPADPGVSALAFGVTEAELKQRQALREKLLNILGREGLTAEHRLPEKREKDAAERPALNQAIESRQPERPLDIVSVDEAMVFDDVDAEGSKSPVLAERPVPYSTAGSVDSKHKVAIDALEQKRAQAAFDRLSEYAPATPKSRKKQASAGNIGLVEELRLDRAFDTDQAPADDRQAFPDFKERVEIGVARDAFVAAPAPGAPGRRMRDSEPETASAVQAPALVRMFESEIDPFEFGLVGSGHFVLYRKVWRDGQRHIQGAVIERSALLRDLVETPFRETVLAGMSRLGIAFDQEILSALGGRQGRSYLSSTEELSGTLLYRGRLSSPLNRLELILSVTRMPSGAAGGLILWVALTLGLVLSGGLVLMYRLGARQIDLSQQQRDFVSAVSHELKTPLTSIRMYSEMLREGWADEERRRSYYEFIHDESERLSRLISNVLQLARMGRDELKVEPQPASVRQLLDMVESKVTTQVAHAGFHLQLVCSETVADRVLAVDHDAFVQIMINLVDNAIKFSALADERLIEISARGSGDDQVEFAVRDHGAGIARDQMKKIFQLFYRSENELTRETVGTGIGLALVHRLAAAMGGEVDVVNRDPGAEFLVRFTVQRPR